MFQQPPLDGLLLFPIIMLTPTLLFFLIFLRSGVKTKQKMFVYLTLLFGIYALSPVFQMGSIVASNQSMTELFYLIYQVFEIISLLLLIFVLEMFEKNIIFSGRVTFFSILAALAIGAMLAKPELTSNSMGFGFSVAITSFSTSQILKVCFYISAGCWLIVTLLKNLKASNSPLQKKLVLGLLFGILFTNLLSSLDIIPLPIFQILGSFPFFQTIGMVLIGLSFKRVSNNPWLLQRQRIHMLLVYLLESGINIYSHSFNNEKIYPDVNILGGAFSAVTSLFKEATKTSGTVQSIKLDGKELRLVNREGFVVALLIDYVTQGSEMALSKFADKFEKTFSTELSQFSGDLSVFDRADTELANCFV